MLTDANKGITVSYNHLNLPDNISFTGGEQLEWLYTAGGQKLRKKATTASSTTTTKHYIGKVQYLDTGLEFINHAEGRIIPTITGYAVDSTPTYSYEYEYSLQDHLGNARVFFSDRNGNGSVEVSTTGGYNEVLQQEHYYPFGMGIRGEWKFKQAQIGGVNLYQYNGKELNEDFGLNWSDYGARWYDASIGRWGGVDPLAESYNNWSEYNYVMGNPLKFVDPDGMRVESPIFGTDGELLGTDAQGWEGEAIVMNEENFEQGMSHEDALSAGTELGSYTEGIRISGADWNTVEANGGERMHPYVTNNSDETVFFKPEGSQFGLDNAGAYPIAANTDLYVPVDGVAAPHVKKEVMFKVVTGGSVTITNNDVSASTKGIKQYIGQIVKGGWLDRSWYEDNNQPQYQNDFAPPCCGSTGYHDEPKERKFIKGPQDTSWNSLFHKSF